MFFTFQHGILLEMLNSYVTLAQTLNLSKAVEILGSTRQTVRRHIKALEEARGARLFEVSNHQYHLTEAGKASLYEAQNILQRADAWLKGGQANINGLEVIQHEVEGGQRYYSQQHHLNQLWQSGTPLLRKAFDCWARAQGEIESPEMAPIRPYILIYRRVGNAWQCVEIGDKSAYAKWFGWKWVKSSVGYMVTDTPGGADSASHVSDAYETINLKGGVRLDHMYRTLPREPGGPMLPAKLQRLLFGCTFPDGNRAIGSIVEFTSDIDLSLISKGDIQPVPAELQAEFQTDFT